MDQPTLARTRAYRTALLCGGLPLVVGIGIFLLWLATRWQWLMVAGYFTTLGGVVVVLIGAVALGRFWWLARRSEGTPHRRLWLLAIGGAALLLSNFAVAGGIVVAAIAIDTRYTVTVRNFSEHPITAVSVSGGGCAAEFGNIPPSGAVKRSFWIQGDGELELRGMWGTTARTEIIDGYVTNSMGGDTTVAVQPNGTILVSQKRH